VSRPLAAARREGHNDVVPSWGSFSYAFGPLVALAGIVVMVLILRWAFSRGQSVVAPTPQPGDPLDYGLLVPIAEPATAAEAARMRVTLRSAGIVAGITDTTNGLRVMVWPQDAARAEQVLGTCPGGDTAQA
jgi:hypothetical protein